MKYKKPTCEELEDGVKKIEDDVESYRLLVDQSPVGIGYWSLDCKLIYLNKYFCGLMNCELDNIIGKSVSELFGEEMGSLVDKRFRECIELNTHNSGEDAIELVKEANLEECPFDVVFLDMTVPGAMGGKKPHLC